MEAARVNRWPLPAGFRAEHEQGHQDQRHRQEGGMLLARKVLSMIDGAEADSEMLSTTLVVRST